MSDRIAVMSKGKVRQIGSPRDIYDRPAERFVANFIGDTNFLEGEVANLSDENAVVRLSSGASVTAGVPEGVKPAGKVTLVIRPEHAELVPAGDRADLSGRLSNVVYFGTDTHYYVQLAAGEVFIVRQQNTHGGRDSFKEGQPVGVRLKANAAQVLKD